MPRVAVAQNYGLHGHLGRYGSLQQIGVEGQKAVTFPGRAFREKRDAVALRQGLRYLMDDTQGISFALSLDEQCAAPTHQPTHQRPAQDIRLRHKAGLRAA